MAAVAVDVGRVDEMESFGGVIASDDFQGVTVLDGDMFEAGAKMFSKIVFGVRQFLGHATGEVISEGAIKHAGETCFAKNPDSPCTLGLIEELGIVENMCCMGVHVTAMQGFVYFRF